ncbi:MAG: RNA polymerase sigma factor [bacterium]|nr:RNA polymerase sigma factor [bacterium]
MTTLQKEEQKEVLAVAHHDFEKGLNAHAFFKVNDHEACEDLVQETFLKTWKYLVRGGKIEVMKAFLYHVLNNLIIDQYRKHKTTSLDALLEGGYEPQVDYSERFFNFLDGKRASLLIGTLPEKYRKIVHMRYMQDLSLSEMSFITGQSKNTMAVQTYRGLAKLKLLYNRV